MCTSETSQEDCYVESLSKSGYLGALVSDCKLGEGVAMLTLNERKMTRSRIDSTRKNEERTKRERNERRMNRGRKGIKSRLVGPR